MIVAKSKKETNSFEYIYISVDSGVLQLQHFKLSPECNKPGNFVDSDYQLIAERCYKLEEIFVPQTTFTFHFKQIGGFCEFPINYIKAVNSRDGLAVWLDHYYLKGEIIIHLYFDQKVDDYLIICNKPLKTELDYEVRSINEYVSDVIKLYYPSYSENYQIRMARRDLIMQLDPNDSLASLESQVDLLTRMILMLLKEFPEKKDSILETFPELAEFETKFETASVMTVKSMTKCLDEVFIKKAEIRGLQQEYYKIKAGR